MIWLLYIYLSLQMLANDSRYHNVQVIMLFLLNLPITQTKYIGKMLINQQSQKYNHVHCYNKLQCKHGLSALMYGCDIKEFKRFKGSQGGLWTDSKICFTYFTLL